MVPPSDEKALRRALWVGRIALIWALVIAGRLVWLQVVRHEDYLAAARSQQRHRVPIPSLRGEILDREGYPLAISIRTRSAVVNPQRVVDPIFFSRLIAPVLGLEPKDLASRLFEYKNRGARRAAGRSYFVLKRHLTSEEKDRLAQLRRTFPIEIVEDARREYPGGLIGAHVVGSIDAEGNGNAGLEQRLNAELKGKAGQMIVLTGSRADHYISWVKEEARQGANLTLGIHRVIQYEAEAALKDGIREAHAAGGTVVALDPRNGEVLALANYPSFDPRREKPTPAEAQARHSNVAAQIPCEPGSVMKMITLTMGLDLGKVTPDTPVYCENGSFARPGRRAIHDVHGYGTLTAAQVLIKSSNIGMAKISLMCGPRNLYDYLKRFGIGEKTGIEIPAESRGVLRPLECAGRNDNWCWGPNSHEYIAFGHEVSATAIQLARAVSVIANGGLLVRPHMIIAKKQPLGDGRFVDIPVEVPQPVRTMRPETTFTVRQIMERVILEGTGKRAAIPGYSAGGKTGSAEIFENGAWLDLHNSSFIGFAPVTNPRVVVVVTLSRTSKQGGIAAAPVFGRVAGAALRVLKVPKDRPETDVETAKPPLETNELPENRIAKVEPVKPEPVQTMQAETEPEPPSAELLGPRVPDFRGKNMVAVLRESASLGLDVRVTGQGFARQQQPAPGTILPAGSTVRVEFSPRP
ncbi:MAG: transpeptidase family protein [Bryobacteraceae bacterium]|nr:transpeptidase family protein [Bryobacteraceae bacterium]